MILKILKYPNPILRKVSVPVTEITQSVIDLAEDMYQTMILSGGVGLAAPQVGVNIRLIILNTPNLGDLIDPQFPYCCMINPTIIESSKSMQENIEYCLSFPGKHKKRKRPKEVTVKYLDLQNKEVVVRLSGINAICVSHEIEHLEGKLLLDP